MIGWLLEPGHVICDLADDVVITGKGTLGLVNAGLINTGSGDDNLQGSATEQGGVGLLNVDTINTGSGNDRITGKGTLGLVNAGLIATGAGNDTVDAFTGGFAGSGTIDLGAGHDELRGFGNGHFSGGEGIDTLTFKAGTYSISSKSLNSGHYAIAMVGDTSGAVMHVSGFERFGSGANQHNFLTSALSPAHQVVFF